MMAIAAGTAVKDMSLETTTTGVAETKLKW